MKSTSKRAKYNYLKPGWFTKYGCDDNGVVHYCYFLWMDSPGDIQNLEIVTENCYANECKWKSNFVLQTIGMVGEFRRRVVHGIG